MSHTEDQNLSIAIYKDQPNINGTDGISQNRIIEIFNFLSDEDCRNFISYIENKKNGWGHAASYSYRLGYFPESDKELLKFSLPENFCKTLTIKIKKTVEDYFLRPVSLNTIHVHKLGAGALGHFHSDNTNEDGTPSHFDINKYAAIIYLNNSYSGGEISFLDHQLEIRPESGSLLIFPGGKENVHGVKEITFGDRYSIVSFWDFADSKYSLEKEEWREKQMREWSDAWLEKWEKDWSSKWKTWNFM